MPQQQKAFSGELKSDKDSLSYALGVNIGSSFKQSEMDSIDFDVLKAAMKEAYMGDSTLMNGQEAQQFLQTYMQAARERKMNAQYADRKLENEQYLEENAEREEVTVTPSGLQYEVLEEGTGPKPQATDVVRVHYKGKLIDGTVFDSSYERDQPAQFGLNRVIPGWTEGLQLMPVGSKYKLYIPQEIGYGARDQGSIPPFSTLVFEVELLDIVDQQQNAQ